MEEELKGYNDYWKNKILRNVERDEEINKTLNALGWSVVRIWESEIKKDVDGCVLSVEEALFSAMLQHNESDIYFE